MRRRRQNWNSAQTTARRLGTKSYHPKLDVQVKAVYLDRVFYNSTCLELLYAHNYAYVMPIVKCGETSQDALSSSWSRVIEHELAGQVPFPPEKPRMGEPLLHALRVPNHQIPAVIAAV